MTPDERRMLTDLAGKIAQTPAPPRDPEAEEFIRTQIGRRPDALYLMTQTVLIQNLALDQAKRQIQELQGRAGQTQSGSFLNQSGAGGGYSSSAVPSPSGGSGAPQPSYAQASMPQPGSGAPSFLRGAAQTAAGVAAGALAFEGIRSLFSHPGYGMEGGYGMGGFGGGAPVEETVVNNYYDNPGGAGNNLAAAGNDSGLDLRDNRDDFADPGGVDDSNQYDDVSADDSLGFDSGDGGGLDDDNFA
jgi:uncharacterized protein